MKGLITIVGIGLLSGCASNPNERGGAFAAAGVLDHMLETASIEEYILALPPFDFHEESVEKFTERVRNARKTEKENLGMDRDHLFVAGDGSSPSKVFILDRSQTTLTIRSMSSNPNIAYTSVTMRRIPGIWMRGPSVESVKATI